MTTLILSILLVSSFVGIGIKQKRELPESISAMVNLFKGPQKWLWSLWLIAVTICTFAPTIDILSEKGLEAFGFLPMVPLGSVAVMPIFDKEHKTAHNINGIIAGVMSLVTTALICPWWLSTWSLFASLVGGAYICPKKWIAKVIKGKEVFVAEMVCWLAVIGAALTVI